MKIIRAAMPFTALPQSSYAIHCAALELMKMDGFEFQYTFDNKEDYTLYSERYTAAYSEQSDRIRAGGFQIYTSLDSGLQAVLQTQIDASLSGFTELQENGKFALQGAGVIVDNKTNYVTAIVGGRGADDPFNRAYLSARQPGSTIKPLIDYGPAFDTGEYYPTRMVNDHKWEKGPDPFNRAYLSARQPGSTIKPLIDYGPAFDTGEYYPTRMVNDHKWEKGPSNSGRRYFGNVTVREALNRSLNTVAWQILEDIGIDFGLSYLGEMEFQKLSYVDNQVPSLSIGGFTNGVRVVDMAKGYSTLANGGVYNDRTCIVKILHEKESELTKDMTPFAKQVYRSDSAFMLTDVLKGTFTSPYGTGRGLGLENDMPAAGKTGTTNSSKDTWFCGYTPYYTAAVWVGYDIPRNMPGIYGATYAGKIWKNVMDEIHQGLPPLDWEQPDTVERRADETNGIEDYFSTTAQFRAQQSLHEKEQAALLEELTQEAEAFCAREIRSVEDTYTVKDEYASITSRLPLLDDGEQRALLLEQTEQRYDYFVSIISQMGDEIRRYEEQKAAEEKKAREEAAKEAEKQRLEEDKATKKNSFLLALETVEELEYQREDAERLVNDAIDKLSLIAGDPEADALSDRLQTAISRISTLPTAEEWEKLQAQEAEQEAKKEQEAQLEIQSSQARLRSSLSRERFKWNNMEYYGPGGRGDE